MALNRVWGWCELGLAPFPIPIHMLDRCARGLMPCGGDVVRRRVPPVCVEGGGWCVDTCGCEQLGPRGRDNP